MHPPLLPSLLLSSALGLLACGTPRAPSLPDGQQNDPCGVGEETTRKCAFPLECRRRPIEAVDPSDEQHLVAGENGACGGVAGRRCAGGLSCEMAESDLGIADAMGTCRQQWLCMPKK